MTDGKNKNKIKGQYSDLILSNKMKIEHFIKLFIDAVYVLEIFT